MRSTALKKVTWITAVVLAVATIVLAAIRVYVA